MSREQGSVLLMVLVFTSVLFTLALGILGRIQTYVQDSKSYQQKIQANALAQCGLVWAKLWLSRALEKKSLFLEHSQNKTLGSNTVFWSIQDEQAKFPLNFLIDKRGNIAAPYGQIFLRLLQEQGISLQRAQKILLAIKDWSDRDKLNSGDNGFEQSYYQNVLVPNRPLFFLGELRFIAGVGKELFQRLKKYVTLYSNGKINVNTASVLTLASLITPKERDYFKFAQRMKAYRENSLHLEQLTSPLWYNRVAGAKNFKLYHCITVRSHYFSILSRAKTGFTSYSIKLIVKIARNKENKIILQPVFREIF